MQVVPANDAGSLHLQRLDNAGEDAAADADVAGERALLVNVVALQSLRRRKGGGGEGKRGRERRKKKKKKKEK